MKKKVLGLLLTAALVLGLAACGGSGSAEKSTEAGGSATSDGKTLKVAMECGYAPYNWTQGDDSNNAVQIAITIDSVTKCNAALIKRIICACNDSVENSFIKPL